MAVLADAVLEFLEVATHHVLCCFGVYPREVFERRSKYGTGVHISRHVQLSEYIAAQLLGLREWLAKVGPLMRTFREMGCWGGGRAGL